MPDSEPDNYSLDEMMQRLRSQGESSAEGEKRLVTREDGTQVVKVKKRKRRSHQPHKDEELKRRKRSLVVAAMISVLVVLLALGGFGWVLHLNGSGYRDQVSERLEHWTGARIDMRSFRATPVSAAADVVDLTWPESSPAARMKLNQVRGDLMLSSHLTGVWKGERLRVGSGELVFRGATGSASDDGQDSRTGDLPFQAPISFSRFRVLFGDGERPAMQVTEVQGSMNVPDPSMASANIILDGGRTRVGKWGVFDIGSASLSMSSSGVSLGSLRLTTEQAPDARIRLSSETYPDLQLRGGVSTVGLEVISAPSELILGARIGTLIDGVFDTTGEGATGECEFDLTQLDSIKLSGSLQTARASSLKLFKLQMFSVLAEALDNPRFAQPRFEKPSRLAFERSVDQVRLHGLDFDSDGMLRIQGEMEVVAGRLSGQLRVGIPELLLAAAPSREVPLVFREAQNGYRWCTVTLSGTTGAPTDDLMSQFKAAKDGSSPAAEGSGGLDDEFRNLTTPER